MYCLFLNGSYACVDSGMFVNFFTLVLYTLVRVFGQPPYDDGMYKCAVLRLVVFVAHVCSLSDCVDEVCLFVCRRCGSGWVGLS